MTQIKSYWKTNLKCMMRVKPTKVTDERIVVDKGQGLSKRIARQMIECLVKS